MARESLNSKITEKDRRDSDSEEQALVPDTGRYRQIQMLSQARLQKHLNLSVHHCQRQRVPALAASPLCPPTWIPLCKSSVVKIPSSLQFRSNDESTNAIPQLKHIEIDQQSIPLPRQFQIGDQLCLMDRLKIFHSFNLHNDSFLHQ